MTITRVLLIGLTLLLSGPAAATTLEVPESIELVTIDGATVNSALLRSVGSLELTKGKHQLTFILNNRAFPREKTLYPAAPVYVLGYFDTGDAQRLRLRLPQLATGEQVRRFLLRPEPILLDEHGTVVNATYRRLPAQGGDSPPQLNKPNVVHRLMPLAPATPPGIPDPSIGPLNRLQRYFAMLSV
ncbi:DUF2057 family protein [Martelella alba]|uniref:DUF2057 domain-containing protein n=1 Tax=Martelella alba TaxID=2590451 RepID=A0ABY2SQ11_9HYPH|nr:DUF2057 family protein [Martelella alba]TKI07530.1 DUF2057 domain-containing protein [Martelella alba]